MIKPLSIGKSLEMLIASMLLDANRELYLPAVDDHGVDMIVRTRIHIPGDGSKPENYEFQEIQVKSVSTGGLFVTDCQPRSNYWFVFFIRDIETIWLINSEDLHRIASINRPGTKNAGKHSLDLIPRKSNPRKNFEYIITDFSTLP